jgi:glutamyl-tRNA reductase
VAAANKEERIRESERAERIVIEEREHFDGWLVALQAVPTIRDLRRRTEEIRQAEVERYAGRIGLDDDQHQALEKLTRGIVNKIMHAPISRLRDETDRDMGLARLEEVRLLFGLDDSTEEGSEGGVDVNSSGESASDLANDIENRSGMNRDSDPERPPGVEDVEKSS